MTPFARNTLPRPSRPFATRKATTSRTVQAGMTSRRGGAVVGLLKLLRADTAFAFPVGAMPVVAPLSQEGYGATDRLRARVSKSAVKHDRKASKMLSTCANSDANSPSIQGNSGALTTIRMPRKIAKPDEFGNSRPQKFAFIKQRTHLKKRMRKASSQQRH